MSCPSCLGHLFAMNAGISAHPPPPLPHQPIQPISSMIRIQLNTYNSRESPSGAPYTLR